MDIALKPVETFRNDFTARNSDTAILRFPFPFSADKYMYAVNMEPHTRSGASPVYDAVFDIDEHYIGECRDRALVLARDPARCQVMRHMMAAEWDTLEILMDNLSTDYPSLFSLEKSDNHWVWTNRALGVCDRFVFGKPETLPYPPFEYITRQVQGDFTLQDQRENNLFMDGGMVTSQADWSLNFDLGMNFHEWHGPVPIAHGMGVFDRALKYLLRLQYGKPVRRLNWTMTVNPRLDTSPENYPLWGPDKANVTPENISKILCLRVELQTLTRLPRSNAILFCVRGYLIRLDELVRVSKWAKRLHRVLQNLHPDLIAYKGLGRFRQTAIDYLAVLDDGAPLLSGPQPDQDRL